MIRALLIIVILIALCFASLLFGARPDVGFADLSILWSSAPPIDANAIVVQDIRLPRTLGGMIAGCCLGIAGALMQTLTRNPLADPGLLGVNAGAGVAIVLSVWISGPVSQSALVLPALLGAFSVLLVVWAFGAFSSSPLTLILAGAALTALLSAVLRAILLLDYFVMETYRDWTIGVLDHVDFEVLKVASSLGFFGLIFAFIAARRLDSLALGDDLASALGTNLTTARIATLLGAGILATSAVLIAGPLVFVGLVAPHMARSLSLQSGLSLMSYAGIIGACLVLAADTMGRLIAPGFVIEAGLGVTLIGGIFLIYIVRRDGRNPA